MRPVNISAVMTRDGTCQATFFWEVSKGNLLCKVIGFFIAYNADVRFDFDSRQFTVQNAGAVTEQLAWPCKDIVKTARAYISKLTFVMPASYAQAVCSWKVCWNYLCPGVMPTSI